MSSPRWCVFGAALGLALSSAGRAGSVPFDDGFESGTLLTTDAPPGRWEFEDAPAGCSHSASSAAAHTGAFGYRLIDNDTTAGSAGQPVIHSHQPVTTSNFYVRTWFRPSSAVNVGVGVEVLLVLANLPGSGLLSFELIGAGPNLFAGAWNGLGNVLPLIDAGTLSQGQWYLLEAAAMGLGTDAGTHAVFVNGAVVATIGNVDWSGVGPQQITKLLLGVNWARQRSATVVFDYDDVRTSAAPLASTLSLSVPPQVAVGDCAPVTVGLVDSIAGASSPAPYDVQVQLAGTGPTHSLFSDPSCTQGATSATLSSGTAMGTLYLRASDAGTLLFQATNADFISATGQLDVQPGGSAPSALPYQVSCDCSSGAAAGAGWLGVAALLVLRSVRARRALT